MHAFRSNPYFPQGGLKDPPLVQLSEYLKAQPLESLRTLTQFWLPLPQGQCYLCYVGWGGGFQNWRSIPYPQIVQHIEYESPTRPRTLSKDGFVILRFCFAPSLGLKLEAGTKLNKKPSIWRKIYQQFCVCKGFYQLLYLVCNDLQNWIYPILQFKDVHNSYTEVSIKRFGSHALAEGS